ncbi:MAG: glycosyl hydrolase family 32 [Acidimicrobiia bacterium]|nr:glycosyl hydrolase family 32 [Acidimicrobiia bacterium]
MGLRLPDRWIWDFWVAVRDDEYHLFYLQAPRALGNPDLRHRSASVGHAVSTDLTNWTVLPDALHPGERGSWDDVAIWTGSIIENESRWFMFYTGTSHVEEGRIQRVGLATSDDLMSWEREGHEPLIEADDRWYERLGSSEWPEEAWRDPWVIRLDDGFHAFITARANEGPTDGRGVIGHAVSNNLISWQVGPPLSEPGDFGHLEVPQLVDVDDEFVLVFSCQADRVSELRQAALPIEPRDAVYVVHAPGPSGPFAIDAAKAGLPEGLYSGRLVAARDEDWVWLAFVDHDQSGTFIGELSEPVPYPWTPV